MPSTSTRSAPTGHPASVVVSTTLPDRGASPTSSSRLRQPQSHHSKLGVHHSSIGSSHINPSGVTGDSQRIVTATRSLALSPPLSSGSRGNIVGVGGGSQSSTVVALQSVKSQRLAVVVARSLTSAGSASVSNAVVSRHRSSAVVSQALNLGNKLSGERLCCSVGSMKCNNLTTLNRMSHTVND